ncbi:hypothetical protein BDB00DRAFT_317557 [Zychaea mexicana]|uniref:uncharacterized protein n=1 Tax=Zychaea mexicana TaxID=64656 RepID=UPI0022FE3C30|nr:uncharacterized protein BDB00DRAFT_317557 [Zychaea mexicana]KAI9494226.1 hypothetical protein BDB00DRAFT_317557 [Zychaea mexicana]
MSQVCSNCLQTRENRYFQEPTRSYKTCEKCRTNRKRRQNSSSTSNVLQQSTVTRNGSSLDLNNNDTTGNSNRNNKSSSSSLVTLETLYENFTTWTMHQPEGYHYEARLSLDDPLLLLSDMDIAKLICHKVGECDTYKYILKTVNSSAARKGVASFYANCSQSTALAKAPRVNESIPAVSRKRKSKYRKRFDCKGRLSASIDRIARQAHVTIQHETRHEPPEPSRKTPNEVREMIKREALFMGRSAKDIHAHVQQQYPDANITQAQVYYWWREFKQDMPPSTAAATTTTSSVKKPRLRKEEA